MRQASVTIEYFYGSMTILAGHRRLEAGREVAGDRQVGAGAGIDPALLQVAVQLQEAIRQGFGLRRPRARAGRGRARRPEAHSAASAPCLRTTWVSGKAARKARKVPVDGPVLGPARPRGSASSRRDPDVEHVGEATDILRGDPVAPGGRPHRLEQCHGRLLGHVVTVAAAEAARRRERGSPDRRARRRGGRARPERLARLVRKAPPASAAAASGAHSSRMPRLVFWPQAAARRLDRGQDPLADGERRGGEMRRRRIARSRRSPPRSCRGPSAWTCTLPGFSAASSAWQAARNRPAIAAGGSPIIRLPAVQAGAGGEMTCQLRGDVLAG